jgi:Ca-activated chloride channel family protein
VRSLLAPAAALWLVVIGDGAPETPLRGGPAAADSDPAGHPADGLRIVAPAPGERVEGLVTLRAEVGPALAGRVTRVSFRADGLALCSRERPPYECEWDAGRRPAVHVLRVVAELAGGGRRVATMRTAGAPAARAGTAGLTVASDVNVVQVIAVVTDPGGRFVSGLPESAFRVFEDDARQPVTHLIGEGAPREVVVAVDMSSSMTEAMPQVRKAVRAFLSALRPDDQLTLLAFNDNVFTLARRETDLPARLRAVDRLAPWGGTALYDVLLRAMDLLGHRKGRKVLVVFTDGEDQSSRASLADVERRAEVNDAPIYMIGQGRATVDGKLRLLLERLARMSGGRAFHTDRSDDLEPAFAQIVEELDNQYLLGYEPANSARDGTWRRIRLEVEGAGRKVRARQGYRALPSGGRGEDR